MKEIRKIKNVVSMDYEAEDENNNESKKCCPSFIGNDLKNEYGFFHLSVRPLLAPGHESELVYFIKNMGLIQQFMCCDECGKSMRWTPSRSVDFFQWICHTCKKKRSIRDNSPFSEVKCSFKNILLTLLAWCNYEDIEYTAEMLDIKKNIVMGIFHLAGKTVEKYIKSHINVWKIGGPGVIVLVDTFPEGFTNDPRNSSRPILCLAELRDTPPTMWFEALERNSRNLKETTKLNKQKCLEVIQTIIHPESIVVARRTSTLCSYDDLMTIEHKFKILVSNEGLCRHNSQDQNLLENLNVIWKEALDVCMETQYYHHSLVQSFLHSYMWRRRFKQEAYHHLLNEISVFVE